MLITVSDHKSFLFSLLISLCEKTTSLLCYSNAVVTVSFVFGKQGLCKQCSVVINLKKPVFIAIIHK